VGIGSQQTQTSQATTDEDGSTTSWTKSVPIMPTLNATDPVCVLDLDAPRYLDRADVLTFVRRTLLGRAGRVGPYSVP
jgi:hypothetical protein